ncbi:hypothetical protein ACP70R_008252 [Stipagrostis hirtigluma subsp. patula]
MAACPPARARGRTRPRDALVFAAGAAAAVLALLAVPSVLGPAPGVSLPAAGFFPAFPAAHTFYNDPELAYTVDCRRAVGLIRLIRLMHRRRLGVGARQAVRRASLEEGSQDTAAVPVFAFLSVTRGSVLRPGLGRAAGWNGRRMEGRLHAVTSRGEVRGSAS